MKTYKENTEENKRESVSNNESKISKGTNSTFQFVDNRPEAVAQRKMKEMANNSIQTKQAIQLQKMVNNGSSETQEPIQKKENNTGLPNNLKTGMESLSGMSMDDVKVHYNSDKPEKLGALAFAQGTEIFIGPGQEEHLAHEAWHVIQQKEGRVAKTIQLKEGIQINDDAGLEKEADVMGKRALLKTSENNLSLNETELNDDSILQKKESDSNVVQRHIMMASELADSSLDIEDLKAKGIIHFKKKDNSDPIQRVWSVAQDEERANRMASAIDSIYKELTASENVIAQMVVSVVERFGVEFVPVTKIDPTNKSKKSEWFAGIALNEQTKKLTPNGWFDGVGGMFTPGGKQIGIGTDAWETYGSQFIRGNMIHEGTHLVQYSRWLDENRDFIDKNARSSYERGEQESQKAELESNPDKFKMTDDVLYNKATYNQKYKADSGTPFDSFKKEFESYWNESLFSRGAKTIWAEDPKKRKDQIVKKIMAGYARIKVGYVGEGKEEMDNWATEKYKEWSPKNGSEKFFKSEKNRKASNQEANKSSDSLGIP